MRTAVELHTLIHVLIFINARQRQALINKLNNIARNIRTTMHRVIP